MPTPSPSPISAPEYHERTKHHPDDSWERPDPDNKPRDHKRYVERPQRALSDRVRPPQVPTLAALAYPDPGASGADTRGSVDGSVLAQLLYYSVGVTSKAPSEDAPHPTYHRNASCTGALYHIDLYVVAGDAAGIDAGVYHFDPVSYALTELREGDYRGVLAEATGHHPRVDAAPASVVVTSTWWRNAWNYRARTYRHAFWDSGTAVANLLTVAHALDVPAAAVLGFDDGAVAELLGLDTEEEAPLEVVPVGAGAEAPAARPVPDLDPETVPLSPDPKSFPLINRAYAGSSLPDGEAARDWRTRPTSPAPWKRSPGESPRVRLDPVSDTRGSKAPVPVTIGRRRSCRDYTSEALNFRKFSTVLDRAIRPQPIDVVDGASPPAFTDCYLVVHAVETLEPGAYQYHPDGNELERLHAGASRDETTRLMLGQEWGGEAAVAVCFLTDVEAIEDRLGSRGYRAAQFEAGVLGGNLYLATYAHRDLGGTALTFFDDEVTEHFSPRAAGQTPMFAYVFGRSAA